MCPFRANALSCCGCELLTAAAALQYKFNRAANATTCSESLECATLKQIFVAVEANSSLGGEVLVPAGETLGYADIAPLGQNASDGSLTTPMATGVSLTFSVTSGGRAKFDGAGVSRLFVASNVVVAFTNFDFVNSPRPVLAQNSTFTFTNCNFRNNSVAESGGAVLVKIGMLSVPSLISLLS